MRCLVTGGEGFIGQHLIRKLIRIGHDVVSIDRKSNVEQRSKKAVYHVRDIRDDLSNIFMGHYDVIFHLASEVGSGLSMADPNDFVSTNSMGTTKVLEYARTLPKLPKVVLASSATVYGEATYTCAQHGTQFPEFRNKEQLDVGDWELICPHCRVSMKPLAINEIRPLEPASIYGESKLSQERICTLLGRSWGFDVFALRLFGVFGPGQSLGNPYTGVLAFFSTLALANIDIEHYEDGGQLKGYTYIDDVVDAFVKCAQPEYTGINVLNIGMKDPVSILEICEKITQSLNSKSRYYSKGNFRLSDTRHSWPDVSLAQKSLSWQAETTFADGLFNLLEWMQSLPEEVINESLERFRSAQKYALEKGLPL